MLESALRSETLDNSQMTSSASSESRFVIGSLRKLAEAIVLVEYIKSEIEFRPFGASTEKVCGGGMACDSFLNRILTMTTYNSTVGTVVGV